MQTTGVKEEEEEVTGDTCDGLRLMFNVTRWIHGTDGDVESVACGVCAEESVRRGFSNRFFSYHFVGNISDDPIVVAVCDLCHTRMEYEMEEAASITLVQSGVASTVTLDAIHREND